MGLAQQLQLTELRGNQELRTLGVLMRHTAPPCKRDHHYARATLFLEHFIEGSLFLGKVSCSACLSCRGASNLCPSVLSTSVHADDPGADGTAVGHLAKFGRSEPLARAGVICQRHPTRQEGCVCRIDIAIQ